MTIASSECFHYATPRLGALGELGLEKFQIRSGLTAV